MQPMQDNKVIAIKKTYKFKIFLFAEFVENILAEFGAGRYWPLKSIHKFIKHSFINKYFKPNGIVSIDCNGNKIYLNASDEGIATPLIMRRSYEDYELGLFKDSIKKNMTIVDVGANVGVYTLIAAKLVGNNGKVYAFEPEPNNYSLLIKNIESNSYRNVIAIQKAVSDKCDKAELYIDKYNFGKHSLVESNITEKNGFTNIETTTLDDFFSKVATKECIDILKIDVEGAEGLVIKGGENILRQEHLKIFMEFWPKSVENPACNPTDLLHKLKDNGFQMKLIDEKHRCLRQINIQELANFSKGKPIDLILEK